MYVLKTCQAEGLSNSAAEIDVEKYSFNSICDKIVSF